MTKARKVDLLYNIAKGSSTDATSAELRELKKYTVDRCEVKKFVKRDNISKYVSAVDGGFKRSFYDFCVENRLSDRRRKGSSEEAIGKDDKNLGIAWVLIGWLTWGVAVYYILGGKVPSGIAAIIGGVVSLVICKRGRKSAMFTIFILQIVIISILASIVVI